MGRGRIALIAALVGSAAWFASGTAQADPGRTLTRFLDLGPLLSPEEHPFQSSPLLSVTQDVITEAEYNRLTGVRKRVGVSVFGLTGFQGGRDAGRFRTSYANMYTTQVAFDDLFTIEGTGFGVEVSLIVAPCYSVHLGGGYLYHKGKPFENNTFSDLSRLPFYLALRLNAPLALSFDRWLDFENPEYITGMIPFVKIKLQGTWWNRVELSGAALPFYESSRDYFVQGLYPEGYIGGGVEFRVGPIAVFGEAGAYYQLVAPRLSKYFAKDPTSPDEIIPGLPFEFAFQAGITYYFGSGRIFHIMPDVN